MTLVARTTDKSDQYLQWRSRLRDILVNRKEEESFLDELCFHGKCAVSEPIPQMPPMKPSITVDGVGRIALPFCDEQSNTLKKAFQPLVRDMCCWEVPASHVTIQECPKWDAVLKQIFLTSLGRMGLDQETIRHWEIKPVFDKLLLFEVGGCARPWEEQVPNGNSVIGTMLIQLPSKFHGGGMTFLYDFPTIPLNESIEVNMSVASDESFFCSSFFNSYSSLELLPIVWGKRLCLMYQLVATRSPSPDTCFLVDKWMAQNTPEVCELPLREIGEKWDSACPPDLYAHACLLKGHYTEETLSFQNLANEDGDTVRLLRNTTDSVGDPLFNVALMLMFKHEFLFNTKQNRFGTKLWLSTSGERVETDILGVDWLNRSVLQVTGKNDIDHAAFWIDCKDKTERHHSGSTLSQYSGNAATYYRSMVVFWPRSKDVEVLSSVSLRLALAAMKVGKPREVFRRGTMVLDLAEQTKTFNKGVKEGWTHPAAETLKVFASIKVDTAPLIARTVRIISSTCRLLHKEVIDLVFRAADVVCSEEVDCAVIELIKASVPDCGRIDWSKMNSRSRDGKDRKQLFSNTYLWSSLDAADKLMANESAAVRFVELAAGDREIFPKAVDKVLQYANPSLLGKIVETLLWQGEDCPAMTRLCTERLDQVCEILNSGGPAFSWHQRRATFPKYEEHSDEVLKFLHGPEECTCIHGFKDPKDARVWGQLHFGGNLKDRMRLYHFSVEFEPYEFDDGRSVVMLTKTKEISNKEIKRKKKELQEERARLQKVLHIDQKTERPEKRQRHWFDQVVPDTHLW